jgi:hypothetical protein
MGRGRGDMQVSETLGVTPALLAAYTEFLWPILPEGVVELLLDADGRWVNLSDIGTDSNLVRFSFLRKNGRGGGDERGELVALRTAAGCVVRGEIADELVPAWAAFVSEVRKMTGAGVVGTSATPPPQPAGGGVAPQAEVTPEQQAILATLAPEDRKIFEILRAAPTLTAAEVSGRMGILSIGAKAVRSHLTKLYGLGLLPPKRPNHHSRKQKT